MTLNIRSEKNAAGQRRVVFEVAFGKFLFLCVLLLVGFGWIFTFGLLVGRGFMPEERLPALAEIMPGKQTSKQPLSSDEPPKSDTQDVIKTEDLALLRALRAKDSSPPPRVSTPPKKPSPPPQQTAKKHPPGATPPQNTASRYRYLYQVAALQDASAAQRFANHLQGAGLHTVVESVNTGKGVWHRVNVILRGTPADATALKQKLQSLGVRGPLLKEKDRID